MPHADPEARAAYQRAWRTAHPGYDRSRRVEKADTIREVRRKWRKAHPERNRGPRASRAQPTPDAVPMEHPLLDRAWDLVPERSRLTLLVSAEEWDREDARSEAVLAMLEQRDPEAAVRAFFAREAGARRVQAPLIEAIVAEEGS